MYVTKPLSLYKASPSALTIPPPEGPNSGYLVIDDGEPEINCCGCISQTTRIKDLPFPQNKDLTVDYGSDSEEAIFIPILDQPLSSNQYYVIEMHGNHKGEAYQSSKEDDAVTCCCDGVDEKKPKSLDPQDGYQKFEIQRRSSYQFVAKSVASDGVPPMFLRRKDWGIISTNFLNVELNDDAHGINTSLRTSYPSFNFPLSQQNSQLVVVGKWYCPFVFIKEGMTIKNQIKRSRYYQITLEQKWQQICSTENPQNGNNEVNVDVAVETRVASVAGNEAKYNVTNDMMWFTASGDTRVGLHLAVMERMKWEVESFGWVGGSEDGFVIVKKVEKFEGHGGWARFGCYVLVERFAVKRIDGSLVMTCDFRHTNQIRCKWE